MKVVFIRTCFAPFGPVATVTTPDGLTVEKALDFAFAAFNRGSGSEVPFSGPSASAGDVFAVDDSNGHEVKRLFQIESVGFKEL